MHLMFYSFLNIILTIHIWTDDVRIFLNTKFVSNSFVNWIHYKIGHT